MNDSALIDIITGCARGCVIAPAGCGKTEQVARAALHGEGRRLILTHTLAGVDALRARLKEKRADPGHYQISTIAAWSLRIASAFPMRSGLFITMPKTNKEYEAVCAAAVNLIKSGCIDSVIKASYSGVFVDEYQDCIRVQHELVCALSNLIPCCIFGDPLQSIFGFRDNSLPDWDREVLATFLVVAELRRPWRWEQVGNIALGKWLLRCRNELWETGQIDLRSRPPTVHYRRLPGANDTQYYGEKIRLVKEALGALKGEKCIIIGDSQNELGRALLARNVTASAVEPVDCKRLTVFVEKLGKVQGQDRLNLVLDLVKGIMTAADVAKLKKAVKAVCKGTRRPNSIEAACVEISQSQGLRPILHLLEEIPKQQKGWIYRRELYSALCGALRGVIAGTHETLIDAVWDVQNRRRHAGRRFGNRNIGSTLLVKGLEFDHVIIVDVETLKRNDLYVALTRGSRSVTVISETCILRPKNS
ncbi:MAG: UvrD-helicase domain-containing protein [Deltaproteobacteria bacterium]|nr:UvrD-helicase domain-containing protein [Deltaproteobacteria bacterium]